MSSSPLGNIKFVITDQAALIASLSSCWLSSCLGFVIDLIILSFSFLFLSLSFHLYHISLVPTGLLSRVEILGDAARAEQYAKDGGAAETALAQEIANKEKDILMKEQENKSTHLSRDLQNKNQSQTAEVNADASTDTNVDADAASAAVLNDDMVDNNISSNSDNPSSSSLNSTTSTADLSSLMWAHPLHVRLTFRIQSEQDNISKDMLQLTFYYLPILKVVSVVSTISLTDHQ